MTNKRNLPVLTDEEMAEKIRKSIENGERRMSDNRPKTYKGKQVEYRGEISDRESFAGCRGLFGDCDRPMAHRRRCL